MIANVFVILAVITAFWYQVNLIDTLWTCAFLTPITLFIFNKGLAGSANCNVDDSTTSSIKSDK